MAPIVDELPCAVGSPRFTEAERPERFYDELTTTRRMQLQRRIGKTLERLYASYRAPFLNELPHHFVESLWAETR